MTCSQRRDWRHVRSDAGNSQRPGLCGRRCHAGCGQGPADAGSDYSLSYSAAPNCQLDITMLTAAGRFGPNERLIIRYRTQLDANTQNGVALTNVAGAIQWFNADSSNPSARPPRAR